MLVRRRADNLHYFASPLLERIGVRHGFSTRSGGVSPAPFDSLNLGISRDAEVKDPIANVDENYRRFAAAVGLSQAARCWVSQVHGAEVLTARADRDFENGRCADALVTDDPGRALGVKYADCVPILLASGDGRAVAAVHAGWRGLVAGIIPGAVQRLTDLTGQSPADFRAAIGPCISMKNYEVGAEVIAKFRHYFGFEEPAEIVEPCVSIRKTPLNLRGVAYAQLQQARLIRKYIDTTNLCTFAKSADFFSHRRDGAATGRMAALISPVRS